MEFSEIITILEQNAIAIVLSFLVPVIGYYWNYRIKKRDIKNTKKELVLLFGKMIADEPDILNPELTYNIIKSKERDKNIQRTLSRTNVIIEIFEDVQSEFAQNQFIPKDQRIILLEKAKQIIDDIKKYDKIEIEPLSTFSSSLSFLSMIIVMIVTLSIIYTTGITLSEATSVEFPFSLTTIIIIFIGTIIGSAMVYFYVSGITSYDVEEEKIYVGPIFEDLTYSALSTHFGEKQIDRNIKVENRSIDFIITINSRKIPIEVKVGNILYREVKQFYEVKCKITKGIGIIITNSEATENAKKFANKNEIIIFEKITNEEDIVNNLKNILKENKQ